MNGVFIACRTLTPVMRDIDRIRSHSGPEYVREIHDQKVICEREDVLVVLLAGTGQAERDGEWTEYRPDGPQAA